MDGSSSTSLSAIVFWLVSTWVASCVALPTPPALPAVPENFELYDAPKLFRFCRRVWRLCPCFLVLLSPQSWRLCQTRRLCRLFRKTPREEPRAKLFRFCRRV